MGLGVLGLMTRALSVIASPAGRRGLWQPQEWEGERWPLQPADGCWEQSPEVAVGSVEFFG